MGLAGFNVSAFSAAAIPFCLLFCLSERIAEICRISTSLGKDSITLWARALSSAPNKTNWASPGVKAQSSAERCSGHWPLNADAACALRQMIFSLGSHSFRLSIKVLLVCWTFSVRTDLPGAWLVMDKVSASCCLSAAWLSVTAWRQFNIGCDLSRCHAWVLYSMAVL